MFIVSRTIFISSGLSLPSLEIVRVTVVPFGPRINLIASSILRFEVIVELIFKILSPDFIPALYPGRPSARRRICHGSKRYPDTTDENRRHRHGFIPKRFPYDPAIDECRRFCRQ